MAIKTLPYSIVDVFTTRRFSGNPLAVIRNAEGLAATEMQAVAREFGFSETTFVLPPKDGASVAQIRIFTPFAEIPFAGHPNIGTAFVVATEETVAGAVSADNLIFDELGGVVAVRLQREGDHVVGAQITAPQSLKVLGKCDPGLVANCLGCRLTRCRRRESIHVWQPLGYPSHSLSLST